MENLSNKIGILITSWPGHTQIPGGLQKCVDSLSDVEHTILLGCDTHIEDFGITIPENIGFFITGRNQADLPDNFKSHQGEHIQLRMGTEWFCGYKEYLFIFEGDMFLVKKDLSPLVKELGDYDFLWARSRWSFRYLGKFRQN